ncbi:LOW QUALITY PROTEIN: upstream stimulatory factor 2 [Kryptolebias marmoratus]|uniref:LOW QUALITY PROTEIN: upstream stimulatory factor 2 n=1 Tax=Kryptolebias marmoratus TaxID=37003 RepID=UPI0018ACE98B|nr:LOW QUALITY PROTEIN: upstream stimulatory factor 2 [Kryptolebias marmoratus]
MEMLEQNLEGSGSHDKQEAEEVVQLQEGEAVGADEHTAVTITSVPQAAFTDHGVQYQFRTENSGGQVTYRVVQVSEDQLEAAADGTGAVSVVSTAAFTGAPQAVAQVSKGQRSKVRGLFALISETEHGSAVLTPQAVIQNPFSNGGSPGGETVGGETRFAYFPTAAVSDGAAAVSVQAAADPTIAQAGGQFYVMMPPEVLQTTSPRTIVPRTQTFTTKVEAPRAPRDEKRRAQHNEVERRRRDKINNWIVTLSKLIPDCSIDSRTGASKGGILSKACDYIRELRQKNQQLQDGSKEVERVQMENELLRQQIEELKNENALLQAKLQQHGVEVNGDDTPQ